MVNSKKEKDEESNLLDGESNLFEELDVDEDSDLPVHEKFVTNKKLRKIKSRE
jgi:hypothetical protein